MNQEHISRTVDSWIAEEELPVGASLKVIRKSDPDYGLTDEEIQDRNEFIRCYLMQEHELLAGIPEQNAQDDFFIGDYVVTDAEYSAFNTIDFQRLLRPFNKYAYAMKKVMERVKDLAIMHSSISYPEGRQEIHRRYEAFVDRKFRYRLWALTNRYRREADEERRCSMKEKTAELNRRILDCKRIWARYAPPENWDP